MISDLLGRAADTVRPPDDRSDGLSIRAVCLVAGGTWAVLLPIAMLLPGRLGLDPFSLRGAMLPLAVGGLLILAAGAVAYLRPHWAAPVGAGLFSAWVAFTIRALQNGTKYGFYGMTDDHGRLAAMATRYSVTIWPSDGIVAGVPTEYPPLFPWLVGRASAATGVPAWQLLPKAEMVVTSLAVLVGFLLWSRVLRSPGLALAVSVAGFALFHRPWKSYEVLGLAITVPWVILVFSRAERGRLHWVPAGLLGGLLLLDYQGYLMYAAPGIIALAVATLRGEPDRRAYVLYVVRTLALSAVAASPFLIPMGWTRLTGGGQYVADLYQAWGISGDWVPFLGAPLIVALLMLAGLAGLFLCAGSPWVRPMAYMLAGTYVYRIFYALYFVFSEHTGMIHHAAVMTDVLLVTAGVLTMAELVPPLAARIRPVPVRSAGAVALVAVTAWCGITCWNEWAPNVSGNVTSVKDPAQASGVHDYTIKAWTEPSPSGKRARNLKIYKTEWFPVTPIRRDVEQVLGKGVLPRTLSYDERLFAYLPWKGYTTVDRTASLSTIRWYDRFDALAALAKTPASEFAQASAHTRFGSIDVFVLKKQAAGWVWTPMHYDGRQIVFQAGQFDPAVFAVDDSLPNDTVVAVRRAAT